MILIKLNVIANGLNLFAVHHIFYNPVFEMSVGKFEFGYDMHYDHDIISGNLENARVFDLTGYPLTINPEKAHKLSLSKLD